MERDEVGTPREQSVTDPDSLVTMREMTGSWLSGPGSADSEPPRWRGERLGLPAEGPGSLAGLGARFGALVIDWLLAYAVVAVITVVTGTALFDVSSWAVPLVWGVMGVLCVWLFAQPPGQSVLGMGTARVDAPERVGLWRSVVRMVFLFFLLPPLIQDADGRGMHDRATGTALIRTR